MRRRNKFLIVFAIAVFCGLAGYKLRAQLSVPVGPYGSLGFNVNTQGSGTTITVPAQQLVGMTSGSAAMAAAYTTDTATNICSMFPFLVNYTGGQSLLYSWDWYLKATGAGTITVSGGTGVTVVGTATAAQNNIRHFKFAPVNCTPGSAAVNLFSLEAAAF